LYSELVFVVLQKNVVPRGGHKKAEKNSKAEAANPFR
jgi:hypothetical protein